jgi:hypothetical protein
MRQWKINNDRLYDTGEVPYLGVLYEKIQNGEVETLPENYDGWFPFMRMCFSIGDLGITSGIFEALKKKYPNIKIAFASKNYVNHIFGANWMDKWNYNSDNTGAGNIDVVMANNPYIDKIFDVGEFDVVFTDHDRAYTNLIHDGDMIRSCDEPLAEQILRRFGFTDDDIQNIDSRPKLYFTQSEVENCERIIEKHIGNYDYGCLLFASRLERYKNRVWEGEEYLFPYLDDYKNKPVFYYTEYPLEGTKWSEYFNTRINFAELGLTLREQIYIKSKALFNVGYQAGITDLSSGMGSNIITLSPHRTIRENCIRGTQYVFTDGSSKIV